MQALATLNDETFVECAVALGKWLESDQSDHPEERIAQAYRLVTGRAAKPNRVQELSRLHEEVREQSTENAWMVVAQVLLNLDETLTY